MISILLGIGIVLLVVGLIINFKVYGGGEVGVVLSFIGAIIGIISLIAFVVVLVCWSRGRVAQEKINILEEHNVAIEEKVRNTVQIYLDHEKEIYPDILNTSIATLLIVYPEIASNEIIKNEMGLYVDNSNEIKSLKLQIVENSVFAWWLWFGK